MRILSLIIAMLVIAPGGAYAQEGAVVETALDGGAVSTPQNFDNYTPRITAIRINEDDAPAIDGDLSDPIWQEAARIDQFYQVDPDEGAAPSQPTVAYLLYSKKTLYIGVYAYDTEPDQIRRSQMQRDPQLQDDDGIRILIDTFGSFRDAYFFGINPNGARSDALIENNGSFRDQWNTIWRAKASVVEDGWVAEFAIPFQSMSFDSSLDEWNLQIIRTIRRNNEEIRWSNIDQSRNRIDMTNPGRVSGIKDIQSGIGLEIQAFATGAVARDWELGQTDFEFNPSANIFYKITPSLTGSLTFNTDFSDAPLDSRQVNTGRFSLFFPETRDFFLQDAAVFEFGGRIFNNPNGLPFFSRNIGIVNGQPVDIVAGAKLSGKLGPANVGLISTRTGGADTIGVDGQYLSSARVSVPVLSESKLGIVLTNGDPNGETNNTVAGADFQYKKSNLFGQGTLTADFAYVGSINEGVSDDFIGGHVAYRSQTWNSNLRFRDVGENYAPQLGFVNRADIQRIDMNGWRAYRPDDSFIRYAETGGFIGIVANHAGVTLDKFFGTWIFLQNNPGDSVFVEYQYNFELIQEPFSIAGEVPVNIGAYRNDSYKIELDTTRSRPVGVSGQVNWGGVYDGDFISIESGLSLRPSKHFELSAGHEYINFDLPTGEIGIHIASVDSTISFTPDMSIKTEIQYDNISEAFTFFSRFSWEPTPEREIFLSFGHTAIIEREEFPRDFRSLGSSLALRVGHTFRM